MQEFKKKRENRLIGKVCFLKHLYIFFKVRSIAVEKMRKVSEKYGVKNDVDATSDRLILAEKLRESQCENKQLSTVIKKLRMISKWHRVKNKSLLER